MSSINKYLQDAFAVCRTHESNFIEVKRDWGDGASLVRVDFYDFPLNIDVRNFNGRKLKSGSAFPVKVALFYNNGGEMFKNEAEYYAEKKNCGVATFATESVCPCGTFDTKDSPNFVESEACIFQGKIVAVEKVTLDDVKSLHIVFTCLGREYDCFIDECVMPFAEPGNIITGVFNVLGLV